MNEILKKKYNFLKYEYLGRWVSYWHQIDETLKLNPRDVLEIGVGNKTVFNYLKNQSINVISLDIDEGIEPDIVANVLKMPLEDNSFDVILCAEVLEHLPFENLEKGLSEIRRVTKKYVVLSLPHFCPVLKFSFKIPLLKEKKIAFKIPVSIKHKFKGGHYWEIGKKGYPVKKIRNIVEKYFLIKKEFIPLGNEYHHFFVLEK